MEVILPPERDLYRIEPYVILKQVRCHVPTRVRLGSTHAHECGGIERRRTGMTVRRIMGTEVEYGISVPGQPAANPMVTSSQVVNAYGARPELTRGGRARWDYEEESPL